MATAPCLRHGPSSIDSTVEGLSSPPQEVDIGLKVGVEVFVLLLHYWKGFAA